MSSLLDLRDEAARQLSVCNACRYCEGYCAVFPALTRRPLLTSGDVAYLANLCHDCRACHQACMYAPPHEYAIDIPRLLSEARTATFAEYARPAPLGRIFTASGPAAASATAIGIVLALLAVVAAGNLGALTSVETGPGSFYRVVPFLLMLVPSLASAGFVVLALAGAGTLFWRAAVPGPRTLTWTAIRGAAADALTLRYLSGAGDDCYYPDAGRPGPWRRRLHALVFYGFAADLGSTIVAAFEQDVLRVMPPYSLASTPVVLGVAGGLAILAGSTGLLALKAVSARALTSPAALAMDVAFLALLDLAAATGLLLLAFRTTGLMGLLLVLHLGVLTGLYATAPYGKFAHAVYRAAALLVNRLEQAPGKPG